jgi:predicted Rossmann fold nucleotide-binding protein DprA/Smf involved in DNA uptake
VAAPATHILEWLALSLTSGLGPTKARQLIEHFGSAKQFSTRHSPNWKAQGLKPFRRQSVATGKSAELAREEMARAAAAGVTVPSPEDACSPRG